MIVLFLGLIACKQGQKLTLDQDPKTHISQEKISAFEAYVKKDDPAFSYELLDEINGEEYKAYIIRMVSQSWLNSSAVADPIWWHWLTIVVPDNTGYDTAMLIIGGGDRKTPRPNDPDPLTLQTALASGSIVADLHNVPNQPVTFKRDSFGPRYEDALISFGWRQFLEGGAKDSDNEWLARFPMTKASVRAMDVISDFAEKRIDKKIDKFVVAGGSKRGWTTWTTTAVDDRVVAIVPIVIDLLNVIPSFEHHWRVYGFWAPAINDYVQEGIMEWQRTEEYKKLLAETDAIESLISFYQMILENHERPAFDWEVSNWKFLITTDTNYSPSSITLWEAHNTKSRNFQVDSIGRAYQPKAIQLSPEGKYEIAIDPPDKGFKATFVELSFPGTSDIPLKLSTGVIITPRIKILIKSVRF